MAKSLYFAFFHTGGRSTSPTEQPIKKSQSADTSVELKELTLRGMLLAALMTAIFTASDVYLGLKIGLTSSSAIPAAVISMAVLSAFAGSNILENNMVQTQASAAGTLSRIIFALPALIMIGYWESFSFVETTLIALAGGMLGVIFSIPLRHALVVNSKLPYPEGVAAAEILKVGDAIREKQQQPKGQHAAKNKDVWDIVSGSLFAACINFLTTGLQVLSGNCIYWMQAANGSIFQLSAGFSLAMTGAGYLVGLTTGLSIFIGLVLAWGIIVPYLTAITPMPAAFGSDIGAFAMMIWQTKVRLIGTGTMTVAAIWIIVTLFHPLVEGLRTSFQSTRHHTTTGPLPRTEQNLSPRIMVIVTVIMLMILVGTFYGFITDLPLSLFDTWLLVLSMVTLIFTMGFLVASVCGYMAGLFGSTGSPISGIAIIAAIGSSLLLLGVGAYTELLSTQAGIKFAMALSIFTTSVIITTACIANDNLQDLNTGYLVGATPWRQQVALLIGCAVGCVVIAPVMDIVYQAYGFIDAMPRLNMDISQALAPPQSTLIAAITKGIFTGTIPWDMFLTGVGIGVALIVIDSLLKRRGSTFRLPALAVGIGLYIPPTVEIPLVVGAVLGWLIDRSLRKKAVALNKDYAVLEKAAGHRGTLLASGLIVGESLIGVIMAMVIVASVSQGGSDAPLSILSYLGGQSYKTIAQWLGLGVFIASSILFTRLILNTVKSSR